MGLGLPFSCMIHPITCLVRVTRAFRVPRLGLALDSCQNSQLPGTYHSEYLAIT